MSGNLGKYNSACQSSCIPGIEIANKLQITRTKSAIKISMCFFLYESWSLERTKLKNNIAYIIIPNRSVLY